MRSRFRKRTSTRGFALIALLALLIAGAMYFIVSRLDASSVARKREETTGQALAEAKAALVAYAVSVDLSGPKRPGDLPCPDQNNDGVAETSCGSAGGSNQGQRLGRLPWRTLGLSELMDDSGERLWYAVSNNFKNNTRRTPLNSDTTGTITIRDSAGNLLFDASATPSTGVVAVIIAPGGPIQRQDGLLQDRSAANLNNPLHYLDNIASDDNADFDEIVTKTNGFFAGPARDPADPGQLIANDRIIFITRNEIMAAIEKRVAAEVMNCLVNYAAYKESLPGTIDNKGHYPWAADLAASASGNFSDTATTTFGRIPDLLCNTAGNGVGACAGIIGTDTSMLSAWGSVPNCYVTNSWFVQNWREQVFYAIANAYEPGTISPPSCGACLTVDSGNGKQVVIFVARRITGTQSRTSVADKSNAANYLEDSNSAGGVAYLTKSALPTFNDLVRFR